MPMLIPTSTKPRVILGTMTFGPADAPTSRVTSLDEYKATLDAFQAAGYYEIDTARSYNSGKQEAWTAAAGYKARGLKIATKCYPHKGGEHEPAALRASLDKSLQELQTDCVDIFYLHAADRTVPFEKTLEECDKLHREGKFVQLGVSNFTAYEVAEAALICRQHGWVRPSIYQGVYNPLQRSIEAELIPACRRYGLEIVIYNPVAGGLLTGRYSAKDLENTPEDGRFSVKTGIQGEMYRKRYFRNSTFEALSIVEEASKKSGLTLLEIAFRWVVHHSMLNVGGNGKPGNDGIIIGVSKLSQLDGNLKDIDKGPLPQDVLDALDVAWTASKSNVSPYWHMDLDYKYDTQKALFG